MKFQGESPARKFTRNIALPRPDGTAFQVTLAPLPLGFHRRLRDHAITPPVPPQRIARDSSGAILRDSRGQAVVTADQLDTKYRSALELYYQRVATLMVAQALSADDNIEFDTPPPATGDWGDYADALYDELRDAGWVEGDLIRLCDEVCRMSNLVDHDTKAARSDFSPPALPA